MARPRKYNTIEEAKEAQRKQILAYYHRNKDTLNKNKKNYYSELKLCKLCNCRVKRLDIHYNSFKHAENELERELSLTTSQGRDREEACDRSEDTEDEEQE